MIDLASIEKQTISLTRETGAFIRQESAVFDRSRIEQKDVFSNLVSYVDRESEKKLVAGLQAMLPGSGCLAEEGSSIESTNGYQWIIDPLDGTTNFLHNFPLYSISIALAHNDQVKLGIVYDIRNEECFHAYEGGKACCNGKEIRVSAIKQLSESLLATGFPYVQASYFDKYLEVIKAYLKTTHGIRRLGSAALDLAYVACGRLDGYFEYQLQPWDIAAGAFILQQAGGTVSNFSGGPDFLKNGEICAGGQIHAPMLEIIKKLW